MPLKKSMQSFKRLSSDSVSDTGYETLDSVVDDHSQTHSSSISQYADELIDEDEDEDEDESPDEWLESMGVATEEIRRIRSKQVIKQWYSLTDTWGINFVINPLKPNGNYMYHLLQQSVTLHFVFMGFIDSHCNQRLFLQTALTS
jgi:hypothetical protein